MRTLSLNRWQIILPVIILWLAFVFLSAYGINNFQAQNILGFVFLVIVPGLLTILCINIEGLTFWGYASFAVAFSLLELMIVALLGNAVLPFAGITRPLDKPALLLEVYLLIGILLATTWFRVKKIEISIANRAFFDNIRDFLFSTIPALFVPLAVFGAIRLNNGASNILTMIMLGGMGIYFIFLLWHADETGENTVPTAIFFIAVSLLLMTSLRGWYITGHDIQSEYKVFQLAKNAGFWDIAVYRDAYNACMSITILPTLLGNLLSMPDPYVFKILFQIFFAFCPVLVYMIGRHWTSQRISLLGAIYFVGFPTFFTDMPSLIRQEVAFLFFGLMLYIIFAETVDLHLRRLLFMLMGIGIILSHYSTTYTILVIFGLAVASRPLYSKIVAKLRNWSLFKNSALISRSEEMPIAKAKITFVMVIALFGLSFLWTSIITNTGGGLTRVITETASAVKDGFAGDNRSVDVNTLLSFSKSDQGRELQDYIAKVVDPVREQGTSTDYFSESVYAKYFPLKVLGGETIPQTPLGASFAKFGINAGLAMTILGQLLAKLTELLVPLGMVYLLLRKAIVQKVDDELYVIAFYCLIFIALSIILPVISTEYGIFRALQQSMFVIAPIIALGSVLIGNAALFILRPLKKWITGETFAVLLVALFFFYSTHFLPYLFGNAPALINLSNDGSFYDNYLIQSNELVGVSWLTNIVGNDPDAAHGVRLEVQTNRYNKFASITTLSAYAEIIPSAIQKNAYVFLAPATVFKQRATIIYNADQVTYQYPLPFLENNKNLIYNNGGAEVYH